MFIKDTYHYLKRYLDSKKQPLKVSVKYMTSLINYKTYKATYDENAAEKHS